VLFLAGNSSSGKNNRIPWKFVSWTA